MLQCDEINATVHSREAILLARTRRQERRQETVLLLRQHGFVKYAGFINASQTYAPYPKSGYVDIV